MSSKRCGAVSGSFAFEMGCSAARRSRVIYPLFKVDVCRVDEPLPDLAPKGRARSSSLSGFDEDFSNGGLFVESFRLPAVFGLPEAVAVGPWVVPLLSQVGSEGPHSRQGARRLKASPGLAEPVFRPPWN